MIEFLLFLTALMCIGAFMAVWLQYRDPLHPLILLCPLMLAAYVWTPYVSLKDADVTRLLPLEKWPMVLSVNLLFISAYFVGCLWQSRKLGQQRGAAPLFRVLEFVRRERLSNLLNFMRLQRRRVEQITVVAAVYSQIGYWTGIHAAGGFTKAYGQSKGGGWSGSGYLNEAPLLGYPALLMFAASRYGKRLSVVDVAVGFLILAPNLIHGTFGGRRGPLFVSIITLVLGWFLAKGRRPSWGGMIATAIVAALAVVFVGSQRQTVYLGSGEKFSLSKFVSSFQEERSSKGGTFTTASGMILTSEKTGRYLWGKRYLVTMFVRPIPRQLLPEKEAIYEWSNAGGLSEGDWRQVMGWWPESGYATGFAADIFLEFSWWGAIAAFFYGALPGFLWRRAAMEGGIWLIQLGLALMLMIYVPSQSVFAFVYRFMFMSIMTWIAWRMLLGKQWDRWQNYQSAPPPKSKQVAG